MEGDGESTKALLLFVCLFACAVCTQQQQQPAAAVTQCGQQHLPTITGSARQNHTSLGYGGLPYTFPDPPLPPLTRQNKRDPFHPLSTFSLETPSPEGASGGGGVKDTRWGLEKRGQTWG